jgi:hypothetical protein
MGEQALDLRSGLGVLRRHRATLAAAGLLGLVGGVTLTISHPPLYTSTSMVLLPEQPATQQTPRDPGTEAQVAGSAAVLGPAGKLLTPHHSAGWMAAHVHASAPSTNVVAFKAGASDPKLAQRMAQAAAQAEVSYIKDSAGSAASSQKRDLAQRLSDLDASLATLAQQIKATSRRRTIEGPTSASGRADSTALAQLTAEQSDTVLQRDQVKQQAADAATGTAPSTATIIEPAAAGHRPAKVQRFVKYGGSGAGTALLLTMIGLALFARRDRRLRYRDQIADSVGSTVVASVQTRPPHSAAQWTSLMADYQPNTADAWALRQVLHHAESRVTVVSLSGDAAALAIGPQLASYAASTGIRVRLVACQQHDSAAALWASVHNGDETELRRGLFVGTHDPQDPRTTLTVTLVVLDRRHPEVGDVPTEGRTLIALSAGSATAEDLARAAVVLDDAGLRIDGMVVANPDDLDNTSGRVPQRQRAAVSLPSRLTGAGR